MEVLQLLIIFKPNFKLYSLILRCQGEGQQSDIERRMNQIRDDMDLTRSEYEREKLSERLALLSNGAAVIKVTMSTHGHGLYLKFLSFS